MVSTGTWQLAGQRDRYDDEWHSIYRLRLNGLFSARVGTRDQRILLKQAEPGPWAKSQRRAEDPRRMAEPERIPKDHPGPQLTGTAVPDRTPQPPPRRRLRRLGLC